MVNDAVKKKVNVTQMIQIKPVCQILPLNQLSTEQKLTVLPH